MLRSSGMRALTEEELVIVSGGGQFSEIVVTASSWADSPAGIINTDSYNSLSDTSSGGGSPPPPADIVVTAHPTPTGHDTAPHNDPFYEPNWIWRALNNVTLVKNADGSGYEYKYFLAEDGQHLVKYDVNGQNGTDYHLSTSANALGSVTLGQTNGNTAVNGGFSTPVGGVNGGSSNPSTNAASETVYFDRSTPVQ
jgi:hypothetical protein